MNRPQAFLTTYDVIDRVEDRLKVRPSMATIFAWPIPYVLLYGRRRYDPADVEHAIDMLAAGPRRLTKRAAERAARLRGATVRDDAPA
jgi:hypothetical protein